MLPYERQLEIKRAQVDEALRRIGRLEGFELEEIVPALEQWRYRNKLEYSFGDGAGARRRARVRLPRAAGRQQRGADRGLPARLRARQPRARGGAALVSRAGPHARGSAAARSQARRAGRAAGERRSGRPAADGRARLRNLVVREGRRTGQLQVRLVTTDGELEAGALAQALSEALGESLSGVLWTRSRSLAETTAGGETELVWGEAELPERLGELDLRISPEAFFQTNTEMAELLYGVVGEYAALEGWERVYDLYCGIGTIALTLAPRAGELWGIELVEQAVADAIAGARRNEITNAHFFAGDTRLALPELLERAGRPDVLVVDPPRAGLSKKVVRRIIEASPKRIVYVSCNPTTLAPNAAAAGRGRLGPAQGPPGRHVSPDPPHRVRGAARARRRVRRARCAPPRSASKADRDRGAPRSRCPGAGEVLVRVRAAGLNGADMMQRRGLYPAPPGSPQDIPGMELAGEVVGARPRSASASRWAIA